ncbi:hypothetical protein T11_17271 [Trichinella zimbabwensis]|uniref:Uncharacterized protein n=1 Tax=Trichinella zimbabwensis TaxID=268475 RepID=A0A0V1HNU2_9BILA|nr:hypothetical protein T11_17271 [Trichinella zimbabwensis]
MQDVAKEQKIRSWQLFSFFTGFVHRDWIAVVFFALKHHYYLSGYAKFKLKIEQQSNIILAVTNLTRVELFLNVKKNAAFKEEGDDNKRIKLAASLKPIISNCAMLPVTFVQCEQISLNFCSMMISKRLILQTFLEKSSTTQSPHIIIRVISEVALLVSVSKPQMDMELPGQILISIWKSRLN